MRSLWAHRLLGGDPLPTMQVGLEDHASQQRDSASAEAGSASALGPLSACASLTSLSNIFIPQVCMRADKFAHQPNAFRVVENDNGGAVLPEEVLGTLEVAIFSDDDAGNTEQQCRAGAHDTGAESADQR